MIWGQSIKITVLIQGEEVVDNERNSDGYERKSRMIIENEPLTVEWKGRHGKTWGTVQGQVRAAQGQGIL